MSAAKSAAFVWTPIPIDYKDVNTLRQFVTERGKIIPRRISGNCARHQRRVTRAIKQARLLALIPYAPRRRRFVRLE